ncbi:hypothetical protein BH20ACT15_BH20ACT15_01370 [soil metagenome]
MAFTGGVIAGGGGEGNVEEDANDAVFADSDRIFPDRRVVAFYGAPQDAALGALGDGKPGKVALRLREQADAYDRPSRPVVPALELISTIVHTDPGEDGLYRLQQDEQVIKRYLKLARSTGAILLLDIQPGHASFMEEVERLEPYLREPDVGLALDPEWNLGPTGGVPGEEFGSMDADEVNEVSEYLQGLVDEGDLPQKLLVVHQFTDNMISNKQNLLARPDVAVILNVDGVGDPPNKIAKYEELRTPAPAEPLPTGFKLFYEEDTGLMQPQDVLRLRPQPDFVVYE